MINGQKPSRHVVDLDQFMHHLDQSVDKDEKKHMRLYFVRHNDAELAKGLAENNKEHRVIGAVIVGTLRLMASTPPNCEPIKCMACDRDFDDHCMPGAFCIGMSGESFEDALTEDVWMFCSPVCLECCKKTDGELMEFATVEVGKFWDKVDAMDVS